MTNNNAEQIYDNAWNELHERFRIVQEMHGAKRAYESILFEVNFIANFWVCALVPDKRQTMIVNYMRKELARLLSDEAEEMFRAATDETT